MKKRRTRNTRLTPDKERRKQFIIKSVVKRGRRVTWRSVSRWTVRMVKILLVLGVLGGLYWSATEGYRRLFWENLDYALRDVTLNTDGKMLKEQAARVAGFVGERNIFSYDLDKARDALGAHPQVESVEIRRYLPNRIEITLKERKPIAWVTAKAGATSDGAYRTHLIDARGMIFQPKQSFPEYNALPTIHGVPIADLPLGKPVWMAEVMAALELLRHVRETGDFHIASMDVSKGYCVVVTDQKGTEITFGLDDLQGQLRRLTEVQKEAGSIGQDLRTVNVMVTRNIPVTFRPPPEPEPDLDELLREPKTKEDKEAPRPRVVSPPTDSKNNRSTPRKSEPTKPKEPSRRDGEPLLRPFRRV